MKSTHVQLPPIRITFPCDLCALTPHFYLVELGVTGVYIIFALKQRLWVLIRTASIYVLSKTNHNFSSENTSFYS